MKTIVLLLSFCAFLSWGATVDLTEKLFYKNYIQFYFNSVHSRYLVPQGQSAINLYLAHKSIISYTHSFKIDLAAYIRSPQILNAITYLNFKWDEPESKEDIKKLLEMYYLEKRIALDEIADDPRYQKAQRIPGMGPVVIADRVKMWIKALGDITTFRQTLKKATDCVTGLKSTAAYRSGLMRKCLQDNFPTVNGVTTYARTSFAAVDLAQEITNYPGAVISRT